MSPLAGLLAAFIAFLAWGFGDFAIQRSVRAVGAVPALFFIGTFGLFGLLPFVWSDISLFFRQSNLVMLFGFTGIVTFVYSIFLFKSLGLGKLSVIEPVMSFELPITIAIGIIIVGEKITSFQLLLAIIIFIGLIITVIHHEPRRWWHFLRKQPLLERGVILAGIATVLSAMTNVFTGILSQHSKPLLAIWGIHTALAILCLLWMIIRKEVRTSFLHAKKHWRPIVIQGIFDNLAWVAYATAVLVIPISITIAITESYIALAALLGIIINKERLQRHQYAGIIITLVAAITLAVVSET
ncbi:MAG: EamA family transporter [Patescibacteria group bacterium]|jgi:drug/metabolite transporter (DMT)-like permease